MMFIPTIVAWLVRKGLSSKAAPRVAWAGTALVALCAVAALLWAAIAMHDRNVISTNDAKIERKAVKATDQAASERASETITLNQSETEAHNVIAAQPDQPIAPTSHALSCDRLRRAFSPEKLRKMPNYMATCSR